MNHGFQLQGDCTVVFTQEVDGVLTLPSVTVTPAFSLSTATWSAQLYSHLEEKEQYADRKGRGQAFIFYSN